MRAGYLRRPGRTRFAVLGSLGNATKMDGARSSVGRWSYAGIAAFLGILWWGALFGGALGLRIAFDLWPVTLPVAIVSGLLLRWAARIRMADSHGEPIGVH